MPSIPDSAHRRHRLGFGPILLANLVPLVGVARFGWDPGTLVVVYGLELLFTFPFAGVKALFARRSPRTDHDGSNVISVSSDLTETRGSIDLVRGSHRSIHATCRSPPQSSTGPSGF
jgi:hypothetical protein